MALNPVLRKLASQRVQAEKAAFQPPGGGMPVDPAMMGAAPPMDPSMMGAPPMDPSMMGAPPMDPAMMGAAPPMDPAMMGAAPPMDPATPAVAPGQKIKPEQWMQALDYRLYNLQQQITALLNSLNVEVPAGALITPPGSPGSPPPETAMPGGSQDPSQNQPSGSSAIDMISPIAPAAPELAQGKAASADPPEVMEFRQEAEANCPAGYRVVVLKSAGSDVEADLPPKSSSPQPLRGGHSGKTPSLTGPPTAGGSKDPKSRPDKDAPMSAVNTGKSAAQEFAERLAFDLRLDGSLADNVDAAELLCRSRGGRDETLDS